MHKHRSIVVVLLVFSLVAFAQKEKKDYQGEWIGFLPNKSCFNFKVTLEKLTNDTYQLTIANDKIIIDEDVKSSSKDAVVFNVNQQLFFNLAYDQKNEELIGFIKTGRFFYHVSLPSFGKHQFKGSWNPLMFDNGLQSDDIMLYVENTDEGGMAAYPFFGDQRFRGAWTKGFKKEGENLCFRDSNTGLNFKAEFLDNTIELEVFLLDTLLTKTSLKHTEDGWEYNSDPIEQSHTTNTPATLNDGWKTANINDFGIDGKELERLVDSIEGHKLENTHSVLIAKAGKLVFETYYDGYNVNIPHDLRSASKSISSAIIGIAIDDKIINSVDERLYNFVPEYYQYTQDSLKSKISIEDLLTMSSGFDVNNLAAEDYYQNPTNTNPWLETVLEAPVVNEPGTYADYGSANPFLLGISLNERLDMPLETYMDEKLFAPLGITNYINQTDDSEITPYFGGGMLLTSRDLLKFGQLYLDKGKWKGKQIISENWVDLSFKKHVQLQDTKDKNEYGYLWWHDTYEFKGKMIASIEARGAGGQFIFILPALEAVVVITSGNFRNGKGNQPRAILKDFVLPAIVH
ncbi:serine hydrolase domain-containing protein [Maribacter sp. X9]|uniref:serine hydrolase domain-containing protein n=1 Tax=Maribacter sp. X9 TaxID=3402159 RepID=UPI003AF341C5